jgi:hypothetical protein
MDPILYPERKRRRGKKLDPGGPGLFDITDRAPDVPSQVKSRTSIDAAREIPRDSQAKRRQAVKNVIVARDGAARHEIANEIGVEVHWITSSVDALIKMREIEEHATRLVVNPKSGKRCAVLVAIAKDSRASA